MNLLKNRSLKFKVIVNVILLHAVLMGLIVLDMVDRQKEFMSKQLEESALQYAKTLSLNSASWLVTNDLVALEGLVQSYTFSDDIKNAIIMDDTGRVRASLDKKIFNQELTDPISIELLTKIQAADAKDVLIKHHRLYDVISKIELGGITVGYTRVILDSSKVENELGIVTEKGVLYTIIAIALGGFIAWLSTRGFTRKLTFLTSKAKDISEGKRGSGFEPFKGGDEVAILSKAFADMLKTIDDKNKELIEINKNLEKRVIEELEKNIEKEQILIQQSKMAAMGEMMGAIAHQWRQPLNVISLQIMTLQEDYESDELNEENFEEIISKINKTLEYMSKTIDDFRNFFRPSKNIESFYLQKAIQDSISILSAQFKSHNIIINIETKDGNIAVEGYQNEFKQVIINILNNAKDAIELKRKEDRYLAGVINIELKSNDKSAIVTIGDNGGGIDQGIIDKIFTPYFTTKFESQGTGIGLYMSKTIIEKSMNGKLTFTNSKEGAIFEIDIPLRPQKVSSLLS